MSQAVERPPVAAHSEVWHRIREQAACRPEAVALVSIDGAQLSYAMLIEAVEACADRLGDAGMRPGHLVGIELGRGVDAVVAMLAALCLGGGYVPLDPGLPRRRRDLVLAETGPAALVTPDGTEPRPDAVAHPGVAYVIYTSGSTGRPKGVLTPHRALDSFCVAAAGYGPQPGDRVLQFASLGFDASVEEIYPALCVGATVVFRDDDMISRPDLFLDRCGELGITVLDLPTAYWHELVTALDRGEARLPDALRLTIIGGEAAQPDAVRRWQSAAVDRPLRLLNTYGPTETTVVATVADLTAWSGETVPIGRPLPGVSCRVTDAGELVIGGPGVADGYLARPEQTAARFVDGEYLTGDRVRFADGQWEFHGRLDDQVKVRGFRIEPGEVETALRALPGVADAAVLAADGRLVAHLAGDVVPDDVAAALRNVVPDHLVPSAITVHPRLPLTPQGKVDRAALRNHAPVAGCAAGDGNGIAALFTRITGNDGDVFTGDSLDAVRLLAALRHEHGVELTLREFYDDPTVAAVSMRPATAGVTEIGSMSRAPELTALQRDFWVAEQVCPLPAHTLGIRYRWAFDPDPDTLRAALLALARRHPMLRSRLPDDGTEPRLEIDADARLDVTVPLSLGSPDVAGVDLRRGPIAHAYLAGRDLTLLVHHVAFDGWSAGIVADELAALYDDPGAELPPVPWAAPTPVTEADNAYWQRRLDGADLDLDLPADRPRPAGRTYASARLVRLLDEQLAARLRIFAAAQRTSLFPVVLAALQAVLTRYTGHHDVTVLSPVANRPRPDLEPLIGPLLNILPMRGDVSGDPSFTDLLARTRRGVLADLDHQHLPLPALVDALRLPGTSNRNRVSPVMLTVHNTPMPGGGSLRYAGELAPAATMVDLAIGLDFPEGRPVLSADYATELFDAPRVSALLDHLLTLLDAAMRTPDLAVSRLPLLTEAETHRLSHEWNDVAGPRSAATTIHELFEARAAERPDAPALTHRDVTVGYAELDRWANRIARRLRTEGVGRGDRVAICLDREPVLFAAMWGVLKAGAAYVPLDPAYPAERLAYMHDDSGAAVRVDETWLAAGLPDDETALGPIAGADDAAYVIYTSGSTGRPKGVVVSHANLVHAAGMWQQAYGLRPEWTYQQAASFSFDMFVGETLRAHTTGGRLLVVPRETLLDPADLFELMCRERVDTTELVPAVLRALLGHVEQAGARLDLRLLIGGGEKWHVHEYQLARRLVGAGGRVVNAYGVTEVTVDNVWFEGDVSHLAPDAALPIGRPFPDNRVYVLDKHGRLVPPGVAGELYLGGAGVATGYHRRPELTAERFVPDPFAIEPDARMYRTGDTARHHLDGTVDFLGRSDDQVKVNGYRIELGEVEAAVAARPGVAACAAAVHTLPGGFAQLVAYVVGTVPARADLAVALPAQLVPAHLVSLDALPLTPNGKLDRRRLPAPPAATDVEPGAAPSTPSERAVAAAWCAVLGREPGLDDTFFALGGDSFAAIKVVRLLDPQPTLVEFYRHPTVRALAALLSNSAINSSDTLLHCLTATTGSPTVVAVPYSGGSAIAYQPVADALPEGWGLLALELPGHDRSRPDEALLGNAAVAERVVAELRSVTGPVVFYGHCLGVAVTVEIARQAELAGVDVRGVALGAAFPTARLPGRFFDWFYRHVPTDRFTSDREYLSYLRGRGGFTDLDDPADEAFVLRNVRHDSRDAEEYFTAAYRDPAPPMRAPIVAVVGARDRVTEHYEERHREWQHFTAGPVGLAVLPKAGHFFVKSHAEPLRDVITDVIDNMTTDLPTGVADGAPGVQTASDVIEAAGPRPTLGRFATVATGQFLSMLGSGLSTLVLSIWIFQRTGSLTEFAVVSAIGLLPGIIAGPFAGAVADRYDRRRVMLASDATAAVAMGVLALLVVTDGLRLWQIYLAVSVTSVAGAFQRPAYLAAVAQLVPKRFLGHASGISQLGVSVGLVFGPLLGAGLLGLVGFGGVLLIDTLTFVAGVITLLFVRFPNLLFKRREESFGSEVANGWRYVRRRPGLRAALWFFVVDHAFYTLGFAVIVPMLLLEQTPGTVGLVLGAGGLGGLAGSLLMGLWGGTERRVHGLLAFMGIASVAMSLVGATTMPALAVVGMFLLTFGESLAEGHWIAVVQTKVGFELQGRVLSIFIALMMLTMPLGYLVIGPLAQRWVRPLLEPDGPLASSVGLVLGTGPGRGLALLVVVSGLLQLGWSIRGWRTPELRLLEDHLPDALPPAEIGTRDELQRAADLALVPIAAATPAANEEPARA